MAPRDRKAPPSRIVMAAHIRLLILLQLLLGTLVLLGSLVVVLTGEYEDPQWLVIGAWALFVAAAAALTVPWQRFPPGVTGILAAVDIAAIAVLRIGAPSSGFPLLWAFPVIWAAWSFGLLGGGLTVGAVTAAYAAITILDNTDEATLNAVLFPLTLAGLAAVAHHTARRSSAQRELLERQSTALQLAAERARAQEELVTNVLDAVDFGVIRLSRDGVVNLSNRAERRLQRVRERTADATYAADGITPIMDDEQPLARAVRGETFEAELVWHGAPGEDRRALSTTARRVQDSHGEDAGAIVVTEDVTAEQFALRAREDLMASVSHELRTPLTSILGYLELALDDETLTPSTRRGLGVAQRGAERLLQLIGDILATAAASRHGIALSIDPEPIDLSDIVGAAIEAARPRADQRAMTVDSTGVEPAEAWADPHRVRQVVDNLISNAIKYADPYGNIEVGCTTDGHHSWIAVRDHGPGIPLDEQPRLFERYFRGDAVRKTATHGSGLGLAISRDIVRAHGGEITVQSTPGEGATFLVRLPTHDPRKGRS